jgi:hypothetical protein
MAKNITMGKTGDPLLLIHPSKNIKKQLIFNYLTINILIK